MKILVTCQDCGNKFATDKDPDGKWYEKIQCKCGSRNCKESTK